MIIVIVRNDLCLYLNYMQEVVEQQMKTWEGYVDWRNKPAIKGRHGGMLAASFVLG